MARLWSGQLRNHTSVHDRSKRFFSSLQNPIQWVLGILSIVVKQLGFEADYSLPSSATIKKQAFMVYLRITLPLYTVVVTRLCE